MVDTIYRNLRQPDGRFVDLSIADACIAAIEPTGRAASGRAQVVDGDGQLLLPALVESHVHIDKTLWGLPWRPHSAGPSLKDLIANERRVLREISVPIAKRAGGLLENCIARGSLHIRSHIDVDPEIGLRHVEALLALRETYRDVVEMQFVVFPQTGMLIQPGTVELMERALEMGVETVGGLDPAGIDNDPIRHLETIFNLAGKHGRGVDIHLHDGDELGVWQIGRIADFTQARGLAGKVMISLCLGMVKDADRVGSPSGRAAHLAHDHGAADCSLPPVAFPALGVAKLRFDGIRDAWSPFEMATARHAAGPAVRLADLASAFDSATASRAHRLRPGTSAMPDQPAAGRV
jgi:cytosine deaminase